MPSHHIYAVLPEGPVVVHVEDANRAVVESMRRYLKAVAIDHQPPPDEDVAAIRTWNDRHEAQSMLCAIKACVHQ